jgi:hypothetical protein
MAQTETGKKKNFMSDFFILIYSSRGGGVKSMKPLRGGRKHIKVWKPLVYTHSVRDRETVRPYTWWKYEILRSEQSNDGGDGDDDFTMARKNLSMYS